MKSHPTRNLVKGNATDILVVRGAIVNAIFQIAVQKQTNKQAQLTVIKTSKK